MEVHRFDDTGEAYDASQCDDDIHDGDVLIVTSEGVFGFLYAAWPVAVVTANGTPGEFHTPEVTWEVFAEAHPEYVESIVRARAEAALAGFTATA